MLLRRVEIIERIRRRSYWILPLGRGAVFRRRRRAHGEQRRLLRTLGGLPFLLPLVIVHIVGVAIAGVAVLLVGGLASRV
jgi:hypothetical protein